MDTGFIGLGTMGRAMAANLLKAGHHVRGWNRSQEPVRALAGQGATACASPAEAFRAGVVISMLADDAAVRQVLSKDVLANAPRSAIHVNMATISVALAKDLTQVHAEHGLHYVAAPVFGRPDVAEAAKLNIVAAGEPSTLDHVAPLFEAMGQKTWRMGEEPYRANVVKLAGNFMLGCAITSSHFGFLGCGGVGWLGWGRLRRCSAGRARWRPSEGQGFQELGPGGEHNIGAQGLQVVEEAGSGSKRLAGVPPSA